MIITTTNKRYKKLPGHLGYSRVIARFNFCVT